MTVKEAQRFHSVCQSCKLFHIFSSDVNFVTVTHSMLQAASVADFTAFMYMGELIEYGSTNQIFKS